MRGIIALLPLLLTVHKNLIKKTRHVVIQKCELQRLQTASGQTLLQSMQHCFTGIFINFEIIPQWITTLFRHSLIFTYSYYIFYKYAYYKENLQQNKNHQKKL